MTNNSEGEMRILFMKLRKILGITLAMFVGVAGYIGIENQMIKVDSVTMSHMDLPEAFEGYKILQITDLHGKTFGENQKRLIKKINELDYDVILFTGDYVDERDVDLKPLEALLKGLPVHKEKYFILGNADAELNSVAELVPGNPFVDLFTTYNVKSLYPAIKLTRGEDSIWFTASPYTGVNEISMEKPDQLKQLEKQVNEEFSKERDPFTIEVAHVPTEIDKQSEDIRYYRENVLGETDDEWIKWDMSISGHTHGGQVRLPFIGAVASPNAGLFPGEMNISGVHKVGDKVQYVCPGLGASGPKILKFRVFNAPTLGLIELESEAK